MKPRTLRPGQRQDAGEILINGRPYHLFVCRTLTNDGEPVLGHVPAPGVVLLSCQFGKRLLAYTAANFAAAVWWNHIMDPTPHDGHPWQCASSVLCFQTRYTVHVVHVGRGTGHYSLDLTAREVRFSYGPPALMARTAVTAVDALFQAPKFRDGVAPAPRTAGDFFLASPIPEAGLPFLLHCTHCGRTYRERRWIEEHLSKQHGVTDPKPGCVPVPAEYLIPERRAA